MCVGEDRVVVMVVCVGGSVGVLMRFGWRSLRWGWMCSGGSGCVFWGVGGWLSGF